MDIKAEKRAIKILKSNLMDEWELTEEQKDEFDELVMRVLKVGREEAKAQAVPNQLDINSILHDIDCYFDNGLSNTERTANNLIQSIYEKLSGEIKAQEQTHE